MVISSLLGTHQAKRSGATKLAANGLYKGEGGLFSKAPSTSSMVSRDTKEGRKAERDKDEVYVGFFSIFEFSLALSGSESSRLESKRNRVIMKQ
ncbi:hypothetical protein PoB_004089300 [Plakobranchus ocellatus]|uniref:Uncharacterized protein n=1 Tax=Plakobranchus ocellatus TaxID=259542 RepID=A0AAV4B5M6_9GAST|nr:hypothetical protein PoB_004089300 [Plakobranchus ocellatus]